MRQVRTEGLGILKDFNTLTTARRVAKQDTNARFECRTFNVAVAKDLSRPQNDEVHPAKPESAFSTILI